MIDGPLNIHTDVVRPEWIDYNNHLNDGYYAVAFTMATDAVQDYVGLDAAYRERTNCSVYTVEAHLTYKREVKVDARLRFTSYILGADDVRLHLFHNMYNEDEGYLAATHELLLLHVDQTVGRTSAMPDDIAQRLEALYNAHAKLDLPPEAGRKVQMRR